MKPSLATTNRIALSVAIIFLAVFFGYSIKCNWDSRDDKEIINELLIQKGKYEKLLDSTCQYIYDKYDEYLPDTYWENDIYWDVYEGAEDRECWPSEDGRNINK